MLEILSPFSMMVTGLVTTILNPLCMAQELQWLRLSQNDESMVTSNISKD